MTLTATEKVHLTWDQIHDAAASVSRKIDASEHDTIVAITRGGMIPAAIIASELDIRSVVSITAKSYDGDQQGGLALSNLPDQQAIEGKRILLIDDIVDSGVTMQAIKEWLIAHKAKKVTTAALYVNAQKGQTVDYSHEQSHQWIVFPWEDLKNSKI